MHEAEATHGERRRRGRGQPALAAVAAVAVVAGGAAGSGAAHAGERIVARPDAALGLTAAAASDVRAIFVLKRQRDDLEQLALAVSDPKSARYGQHRSVAAVAAEYGASAVVRERVAAFLAGFGVTASFDVTGTFATAVLTPAQVEAIFGAHPPASPPVPAAIAGDAIGILGTFPSAAAQALEHREPPRAGAGAGVESWPPWAMGSGTPAPCPAEDPLRCTTVFPRPDPAGDYRSFTPDQLRTAYGMAGTELSGRGRVATVIEFGEAAAPSDVDAYTAGLGLPRLDYRYVLIDTSVIGNGFEATLDVETIAGTAPGVDQLWLFVAPFTTRAHLLTYFPLLHSLALDASRNDGVLTDVVSTSWTLGCEPLLDPAAAVAIAAMEPIYQTAAAAGVTMVAAAGDQGSSACTPREPPYTNRFLAVEYPGSSPWVTSVGGTSLQLHPDNRLRDARVWNDWPLQLDRTLPGCSEPPCRPEPVWAGAGGESALFERPAWQVGRGVDAEGTRQVPDVALLADLYPATLMYLTNGDDDGWVGLGNGTSQAAPLFAAMVLHLNEHAARSGRPRIGFANPLLYRLASDAPAAFFDVVEGNNAIGDDARQFDVDCCFAGPGYDKASGLGTPLLDRTLAALARSLEPIGAPLLPGLWPRPRRTR